jgi:hypothetical protein
MRWAGYVAHLGKMRISYKYLVGKNENKSPDEGIIFKVDVKR